MDPNLVGYLHFYGTLVAVVRPLILAAILFGLWLALGRAGVAPRTRTAVSLAVTVPLVAWFVGIWRLAASGAFQAASGTAPGRALPIPVAVVLPVLIGLLALTRSKRIASAVDAAPTPWLIGLQTYRVLGGNFVVLWLYGVMPSAFALPAGLGDVLVGLTAIPVALFLASGRPGSTAAAVAWNLLGIADLVDALTLGFLSSPGPFQLIGLGHPNVLTTAYPTVMTPAFAVPLSFILHGLSLWQLRRRSRSRATARGVADQLTPVSS
jgi:hypothetical protein